MKRLILAIVVLGTLFGTVRKAQSQAVIPDKQAIIDSLTTIDPNIVKYFPRWKVCEADLLIQLYQSFLYRYDEALLNQQDIEVLAAPKEDPNKPYELLMITCGQASMNAVEIESYLPGMLIGFLSGEFEYKGYNKGFASASGVSKRDYCFTDIPPEVPVSTDQTQVIISFLEPSNVNHAFMLSLFEQSVKIGRSGFWLRNKVGTDEIGYPFWSSGEAKAMLQRPLYVNKDPETRNGIEYLINAYLGAGYRVTSGLTGDNPVLGWVQERGLNTGPGGKFIAGLDFHMPMKPEFGIGFNFELPMSGLDRTTIEESTYARYGTNTAAFEPGNPHASVERIDSVAPLLRATGQVKLFYHLWINKETNPENYFRFELGMSYNEVQEAAVYDYTEDPEENPTAITFLSAEGISGLRLFKPEEFGDWVFAKIEYRNQDVFPFGASIQYSNQMFLGTVYLPIFGDWFYLEGKYSTPLRGLRPYEVKDFYMISPVIRLTI